MKCAVFLVSAIFCAILGETFTITLNDKAALWIVQAGNRENMPSSRALSILHNSVDSSSFNTPLVNGKILEYTSNQNMKNSMLPLVELNGKFYYFEKYFKTNFFKAMQYCKEHGMDLVSIETNLEYIEIVTYLKKTFPKVEYFWTSGSDLGEEGAFVWLATGKPLNFTYWADGQPDNSGKIQHCLELKKTGAEHYHWNDVVCSAEYNFICEVKG